MLASISSSMRVPWGRSQVVVPSTLISGSFSSVSMMSSKYSASLEPWVRLVIFAGFPLVSWA